MPPEQRLRAELQPDRATGLSPVAQLMDSLKAARFASQPLRASEVRSRRPAKGYPQQNSRCHLGIGNTTAPRLAQLGKDSARSRDREPDRPGRDSSEGSLPPPPINGHRSMPPRSR